MLLGNSSDSGLCYVQFYYGEDGLDVMKTSFIKCPRASDKFPPFSFLVGNRSVVVSNDDLSLVKEKTNVEAAPKLNRKVCGYWQVRNGLLVLVEFTVQI